MALTDQEVKSAKIPKGKSLKKLFDGGGLYLLVLKSGKYWRLDYRMSGKRKTLAMGSYPATPLAGNVDALGVYQKGARDLRNEAKRLIKQGIDPSQKKQQDKREHIAAQALLKAEQAIEANTFEVIAREWHSLHLARWSPKHAQTIIRRFELHVFPVIGDIPVAKLTKSHVADLLTSIVKHDTLEIAKRIGQITRQVLEYASDKGVIDAIPMGNTKNLLPSRKARHWPAITEPKRIGEFMRSIYDYQGTFVVCQALKVLPLLAARSGEFRYSQWPEFDFEAALWTIPAIHRKLPKEEKEDPANVHLVPLSKQAIQILKDLKQLTGDAKYVFPSQRSNDKPMSDDAINDAIDTMGYKGEMVGHGVRTMFSSSMNEQGFNPDAIERQLAHKEKNAIRAAYNRAEYLPERTRMMQHWADYLDGLRQGAGVVPLHRLKKVIVA